MISRKYISIVLALLSMVSCLKLQTNGEYDTNGDYWGGYTFNEWLKSERNQNCHIFAQAVKTADLESLFDSIEPSTVIVPNDEAFAQLFSEMGIKSIEEFQPVVLKEILLYLIMSQRYISTDMQDGAVIAAQNIVDKPLYLSRKSSSGNRLQMYVNMHVPAGVKNFAATTATVVMQDVAFKDHVAQIVSNVPYFKEYTLKTDIYKGQPNTEQVFEIPTEADTYLAKTRPESPFDLTLNCNTERIPLILYQAVNSVDFYDDISIARVNFYVPKIDGIAANPFILYDITDQAWELSEQGTDVTKFYKTVISQYTPALSAENKVATFDFDEVGKWTSVDITDYILKHFKTKEVLKNGFLGPTQFLPRKQQRHTYRSCVIKGDVDFIYGGAAAWFEDCDIVCVNRGEGREPSGFATAASTPQGQKYGYVFHRCRFTGEDVPDASFYLGRPWREFAKTILLACYIGPHIKPEGWDNWSKPDFQQTGLYAEYECYGPGSDVSKREYARTLTPQEAATITYENFLNSL